MFHYSKKWKWRGKEEEREMERTTWCGGDGWLA
jgi:hypothetical protein